MVALTVVARLYLEIVNSLRIEVNPMTDEKNKSYAEKNEEKITDFVENINEKGEKKKEQKKQESESEVYE